MGSAWLKLMSKQESNTMQLTTAILSTVLMSPSEASDELYKCFSCAKIDGGAERQQPPQAFKAHINQSRYQFRIRRKHVVQTLNPYQLKQKTNESNTH